MINTFRRLLIRFGKTIPFIFCFIIAVSYVESVLALLTNNLMIYEGSFVLNTPLSFIIADKLEYDWLTIFALTILSYAIEACVWNKISVCYMACQLGFKNCIANIELYTEYIYAICFINIFICVFLLYKGIKNLLK